MKLIGKDGHWIMSVHPASGKFTLGIGAGDFSEPWIEIEMSKEEAERTRDFLVKELAELDA